MATGADLHRFLLVAEMSHNDAPLVMSKKRIKRTTTTEGVTSKAIVHR